MKKTKRKIYDKLTKLVISLFGFLLSIFLVNLTEKNYSFDLENAINLFSSGILIATNIPKGFSILIAFLLVLVLPWFFLYLYNLIKNKN